MASLGIAHLLCPRSGESMQRHVHQTNVGQEARKIQEEWQQGNPNDGGLKYVQYLLMISIWVRDWSKDHGRRKAVAVCFRIIKKNIGTNLSFSFLSSQNSFTLVSPFVWQSWVAVRQKTMTVQIRIAINPMVTDWSALLDWGTNQTLQRSFLHRAMAWLG
jgi:hypothetical protein